MTEAEKSKLTQKFLQCIAQHLSGRADCKGTTYRIAIGVWDSVLLPPCISMFEEELGENRVLFSPNVMVFPDRYRRKETDKVSVVYHVAAAHFDRMLLSYQEDGCTFIETSGLVKGVYEYQSSVDKKKRRWVRIESL